MRPVLADAPRAATDRWLIATDLDGTLLDEETYEYDAAADAIAALHRLGIPLVLATSKTQAEVEALVHRLLPVVAAIVENGGAVVVPARHVAHPPVTARRDGDMLVIELGVNREVLVQHLAAIADEARVVVTGFAALTVEQVAEATGLPPAAARLARERRFDEPFVITGPQEPAALERLVEAAGRRGLQVTRGGRFLHLMGASCDKGRALRTLLALLAAEGRRFTTVGLGDAANDGPLLAAVDRPVIVPRSGGDLDPQLAADLPGAERAPAPGPAGWNAAVLAILEGDELPRVESGRS